MIQKIGTAVYYFMVTSGVVILGTTLVTLIKHAS
jgi:hypothetical protein